MRQYLEMFFRLFILLTLVKGISFLKNYVVEIVKKKYKIFKKLIN